jgi:hypothetical protein
VKHISALIIGFAGAFAIAPAFAEDLTAGKTPAQLFRSDCSACHHAPNGLVKERGNVGGVASFLREHYTTNTESAAALAAYVSGLASPGGSARNRSRRGDGDMPATATVPDDPKPAVDPAARRRRASSRPDDDGKRRTRDDDDALRPPGEVTSSPRSATSAGSNDAEDLVVRLRSYLSSGLDSEGASAQAAATGAPKARKRRGRTDDTVASPPPAEGPPAAHAGPEPKAGGPAETSPQGEPQ